MTQIDKPLIFGNLIDLANSPKPFTDIRIADNEPVLVRMPGGWEIEPDWFPPTTDDIGCLLNEFEPDWEGLLEERGSFNRPCDLAGWRLRVNVCLTNGGKKKLLVIRRIPNKTPTLQQTGLPSFVRLLLQVPRGLILISGPTGAGKSTTLAAMVEAINESKSCHIVTIEDPIEYVFAGKKGVFSQREVGPDVPSFEAGLRDAMRQVPDVIVVGEIRDKETAEIAIAAGESGHLVIGTLHARTAPGTVGKLLSWFPEDEQPAKVQALAGSLIGVVNQLLLPKLDKQGFVVAAEIMNNCDHEFSSQLANVNQMQAQMDRAPDSRKGSVPMSESLAKLVQAKIVSPAEAMNAVIGVPIVQEKLRNTLNTMQKQSG